VTTREEKAVLWIVHANATPLILVGDGVSVAAVGERVVADVDTVGVDFIITKNLWKWNNCRTRRWSNSCVISCNPLHLQHVVL